MGLFDEDSDDSGDGRALLPSSSSAVAAAGGGGGVVGDYEEEEDPLDAYMRSLDAAAPPPPPSSPTGSPSSGGGGRLDVDAEDEATSHWEVKRPKSGDGGGGGARLLPKRGGGDASSAARGSSQGLGEREARSALSSTFVRAGAGKKDGKRSTGGTDGGDDDDDDGFGDLERAEKRRRDMMHQEVDPLARVDHAGIRYGSFRRAFYAPEDTAEGMAWRTEHDVTCAPGGYDPILGFGELGGHGGGHGNGNGSDDRAVFPEELVRAIARSGYDSPTLVQSQTLPVALSGADALVTAATGSGKTLAYIWPMIVHINDQPHIVPGTDGPIGLVLTPTRELAKQVHKYAKTFVECIGGHAVEVSGGNRGTWELTKELKKGCEIVVGSPGRVIDLVKRKGTNLERVTFLVLDEADRMLDMGFEKQVSSILENVRPDRQTLLLSATFGKRVERVARGWLRDPVRIAIGRTGASSEHVDSHVMVLPSRDAKVQWLLEMLPVLSPLGRCLVFVGTRSDCDVISQMVQQSPPFAGGGSDGTTAIVSIHGDKDQRDRNAAISHFKKNPGAVLVATDVAARGLDIPNVRSVINFDPAKNMDAHVHRVGRAGRLSKEGGEAQRGAAYTLLTGRDANFAASLAEAFEREGREVSGELAGLCQRSNRYGGGRAKHSKVGLGFGSGLGMQGAPPSQARKKSRWARAPSTSFEPAEIVVGAASLAILEMISDPSGSAVSIAFIIAAAASATGPAHVGAVGPTCGGIGGNIAPAGGAKGQSPTPGGGGIIPPTGKGIGAGGTGPCIMGTGIMGGGMTRPCITDPYIPC
ncbi:hypothetical protein ACHAWF_007671 [Thalassiosira exigua]